MEFNAWPRNYFINTMKYNPIYNFSSACGCAAPMFIRNYIPFNRRTPHNIPTTRWDHSQCSRMISSDYSTNVSEIINFSAKTITELHKHILLFSGAFNYSRGIHSVTLHNIHFIRTGLRHIQSCVVTYHCCGWPYAHHASGTRHEWRIGIDSLWSRN